MKLRSIALAAASACCATAFAAPAVNIDGASTVRIYSSGASALRNAVFGVVLNDVCGGSASNASTTLYNVTESAGPGSSPTFAGNLWAVSCVLPAAKLGLPAGTPIAFFKTDAGGSAQGVFPVYFQTARPMVQPVPLAGCTTTVTPDRAYTGCPTTRSAVPMVGISDVEPGVFKGANVPNDPLDADDDGFPIDGLSTAQISQLTVKPVVQTVFAVATNKRLYDAMFAKQGLSAKKEAGGAACTNASVDENCVPSIGYAEARSLFQGTESNWRLLTTSADPLVNSQVNICRRVQGSGTQAAANSQLLNFPCSSSPLTPADYSYSSSASPAASSSLTNTMEDGRSFAQYFIDNMGGNFDPVTNLPTGPMPTDSALVFEGPGTGNVVSCLTAANSAQGYAIGHVSRENNESATVKFVKLEGALPARDNEKAGRYDYAFESTMQYRTSAFNALTAQQKSFISGLIAEIAKPSALAKLPSSNQNGVASLPTSYAGAFGTGTPDEIKFGSRVTRSGNSCNGLSATK